MEKDQISEIVHPKRKWWKAPLIFLGVLFLAFLAIIFYSSYQVSRVFTQDDGKSNLLPFVGNIFAERLKGESEGRINMVLLGVGGKKHPGGSLADTIILTSINTKEKKVALISIPRDLGVTIPGVGFNKINYAHAYGEQNAKTTSGGGALTKKTLNQVMDLPIHYYARIDFEGFIKLVDELGGVTVNVEKPINDPFFPAPNMVEFETFKIGAGVQKLDGKIALKYVRSRETTSDFDRAKRQQQVIKSIGEKAISLGFLSNPQKIISTSKIIGNHFRTDLNLVEMQRLISLILKIDHSQIKTKVLDNSANGPLVSTGGESGYYLAPKTGNFKEIQKIIKDIFVEKSEEGETFKLK